MSAPAHRSGGRLSTGLLLGSVALLFGGGGVAYVGLTTGAGGSPGAAPGFLATGPGFVEYLALSGDFGPVSGRAVTVRSGGAPPAETAVGSTVAVSGTLDATRVELSFVGWGTRQGTRSGTSSFLLGGPGGGGHPAPLVFRRASPAAFDAAVTSLDNEVRGADRLASREQAVTAAGARVATDLGDLGQATDQAATAVAALAPELGTAIDDLAATEAQQAQVGQDVSAAADPTSLGALNACPDAALAAADAGNVVSDAEVVEADAVGVQDAVDQLRRLAVVLRADTSTLISTEAALPASPPSSLPTPSAAAQSAVAARAAAASDVSTTNSDLAQVNREVGQADTDATAAAGLAGCGTSTPPPSVTEPPIS